MTTRRAPRNVSWLSAIAAVALLGAACTSGSVTETDDHGHEHAGGPDALIYTHYSDTAELFVEFPALVVGRGSEFAAHMTRLADYRPLESGVMDVRLEQGGRTVARFRVVGVARSGIFTPVVTPRDSGVFELIVEVEDGGFRSRHDLGQVTVFASPDDVVVNQPEIEGDIGYLKEQQWATPFGTTVASTQPLRPSVSGYGVVQIPADAGAEIRAPEDGYFVAAGLAAAGDMVDQGAVLGHLVPRLGEGADFGTLLVELERARAELALAESDVARLQTLFERGAIPERMLFEARQARQVAVAEYNAAEARVEQYQQGNRAAGIALRAPLAGEVIEVTARPGAFVREGDRVFRLAAPERRWLEVRIAERYAANLSRVSGVLLDDVAGSVTVLDQSVGARVVQTSAAVDSITRTASVTIEYPSGIGPTLVGARMPVRVFTAAAEYLLAIPRSAVIDDGGRDVVYVQTGGEAFVRRPVVLGIQDGGWVEVISGLSGGDRVVSTGAYFLKLASVGGEEVGHGHAH